MAYTEFCCRPGGSNLNAGTRNGSGTEPATSADLTYASGSWVASTGVFTVASGNPSTDGVAVGDFASVYADGATVTTLVGRVTAVSSTTITISATAKTGTTTDGTNNRTLRIGGAWQGPNGASGFPLNFITSGCTNAAGDLPRVNLMAGTYSITAAIAASNQYLVVQGFGSTYGDDAARPIIDGGTSGASYVLLTLNGTGSAVQNVEFANNGATGSAGLVTVANFIIASICKCVFKNSRGHGLSTGTGGAIVVIECEAYLCNASNTLSTAGIVVGTAQVMNTISHDNSGSNSTGFRGVGSATMLNCIADTNGSHGFDVQQNTTGVVLTQCDAYNNGGSGFSITVTGNRSYCVIKNSNAVSNAVWGIVAPLSAPVMQSYLLSLCGIGYFGNTSGQSSIGAAWNVTSVGNVTLAESPYTSPASGDFRISGASAKAAGRGTFLQTQSGYAGTIGYPDIGACQSVGGGSGFSMSQLVNLGG